MSTKTKFAAVALAALTLGATVVASTGAAEAKKWHPHHHGYGYGYGWGGVGLAAGLIGAGIASHAYAGPNYVYVGGPRCRWVRQFDDFGSYVGKVKVCRY